MTNKILIFTALLILFSTFLFQHFWYLDVQNQCSIGIIPSTELSNSNIIRALVVLKQALPEEYNKICKNVKTIDTNVSCGGFDGGCYMEKNTNTIYISTGQRDFVWTANVLVHETCHRLQKKENRQFNEDECYKKGDDILNLLTKI